MTQQIIREARVKLTLDEVDAKRIELVGLLGEYNALELKKKDATAALGSRMRDVRQKMTAAQVAAASGYETRSVECHEEQIFQQNAVRVVLTATGEVLETRAMTALDRQVHIKGVEPPPVVAATGKKVKAGKATAPANDDGPAEH